MFFSLGLSAIYLLKAVLHLKCEKITVINNMQLLHCVDTVLLFIQDPYTDVYLLWHAGSSLYLKFIWNFQVSWNFWSTNFHESVSLFNHCSIFKEKFQWQILKRRKIRCGKIENRSRGLESTVRNLTTLPRSSNSLLLVEFDFTHIKTTVTLTGS